MSRRSHRNHSGRRKRRPSAPGTPPGTLLVDPESPRPVMRLLAYGPERLIERDVAHPRELREYLHAWPVCWINVDGLGDAQTLAEIAAVFNLHPLAMEDVVNVHQRPKVEQYGSTLFLVTHMVASADRLETEQVSLFLGRGFIVTFQERPGWDCFEPVRERLRKQVTQIREGDAGYLAYALLDAVIDHYFPVLEAYGDRLEALEEHMVTHPEPAALAQLHDIKRELRQLRRLAWPQREALNSLLRDEYPQISAETRLHLRDCYDHAMRILDMVEVYREVCADLTDLYLSSISNRMNDVMRVLTVISTLFIPLTFIAGVYGMNFDTAASRWNMPELRWSLGYPLCLALMALVAAGQLWFFVRKGWLGAAWRRRKARGVGAGGFGRTGG